MGLDEPTAHAEHATALQQIPENVTDTKDTAHPLKVWYLGGNQKKDKNEKLTSSID